MARGVAHPDETRAAVLAALLTGQAVPEVARTYHIDPKTVKEWYEASTREPVPVQKRPEIGELVAGYLRENLITLTEQAKVFRDAHWLNRQHASEVAVLHGVLADKSYRILEALQMAHDTGRIGDADLP